MLIRGLKFNNFACKEIITKLIGKIKNKGLSNQ